MQDLTTIEAFLAYAEEPMPSDTSLIDRMIAAFSAAVRSYTNRDWTLENYSRTFDGRNNTRIVVPQYPIVSVTAVQAGTQIIPSAPGFGLSGFSFDVNSVMVSGYRFPNGQANVLISWTAGFTTVPADVEEATLEWMAQRYALRGDKAGWSSKTLAGETVSLMTRSMPDTVKMMLDQLKSVVPA